MESILEAAEAVLRQHVGPAVRLSELLRTVRTRTRQPGLDLDRFRRALEADTARFRLLDLWRGPWRHMGVDEAQAFFGDPWVLAASDPGPDDGGAAGPNLLRRMKESVRWLGVGVDPLSPRDLSRWHALAEGERLIRGRFSKAA
jgi:hypothetical protein